MCYTDVINNLIISGRVSDERKEMGDNKITLKVCERTVQGKKVKALRREGIVPIVVYGAGMEPKSVQAPFNDVVRVVKAAGKHTPVYLNIDDKNKITMVKEIGYDATKNQINHVAFHAVRQNKPIEAEVPIRLVGEGESAAEKAGLIILQALDSIEVKALPLDMPEALELDIRGMKEAGDKATVGDIKLPANVEFVEHTDGREDEEDEEKPSILDLQVASVWEPSALAAANDAAAGDADSADAEDVPAENGEAEATKSE